MKTLVATVRSHALILPLLCVLISSILVPVGCGAPVTTEQVPASVTVTETPKTPTTPWAPEPGKMVIYSREQLSNPDGCRVTVPPADEVIIPVSVGEYEHLSSVGYSVRLFNQDRIGWIDFWLVNSYGNKPYANPITRSFNGGISFHTTVDDPGLKPGTYYIYLSNQFDSTNGKDVTLRVSWNP